MRGLLSISAVVVAFSILAFASSGHTGESPDVPSGWKPVTPLPDFWQWEVVPYSSADFPSPLARLLGNSRILEGAFTFPGNVRKVTIVILNANKFGVRAFYSYGSTKNIGVHTAVPYDDSGWARADGDIISDDTISLAWTGRDGRKYRIIIQSSGENTALVTWERRGSDGLRRADATFTTVLPQ